MLLVFVLSTGSLIRAYQDERRARAVREATYSVLEASYLEEIARRDEQIVLLETTTEALSQEVEWARYHVANREREIAELKASASAEVLECLDVVIDPVFAP